MPEKESAYKKPLIIAALAIFILFSIYTGKYLLSFINDPDAFRAWINTFGVFAPLAYVVVTMLQILCPFIPGEPMELIAGYAFGAVKGTLLCILAESLGSIVVLFLVKKFGRKIVEVFFDKEKIDSLGFLKSSKNRIFLYAIAFIVPGTPKDLLCYMAALTDIDVKILLPIITLGRLPSIITSTLAGAHLGDQKYVSAAVYVGIALTLSLCGVIAYRYIENKNRSTSV